MSWSIASLVVVLTAIAGSAIAIKRRLQRAPAARFSARRKLLTDAESEFVRTLELAMKGRYRIVTKARLADVIEPHEALGAAYRRRLFKKITGIGLDCVLCDPGTFEVLAAVRLSPPQRRTATAREEDSFVEAALRSANMHLIRLPLPAECSVTVLAAHIESVMSRDFIDTLTLTPLPNELRTLSSPSG
jgi:hypothetical protein